MLHTNPVEIILWRTLAIFLLIGALLGIALGLLLIFKPQLLTRVNRVANHWISTKHIHQFLDRSTSIEYWFYQHHRAMGVLVAVGAAYIFIYFGILFDKVHTLQSLSRFAAPRLLSWLLDALVLVSLIGSTVAFIVGLFLWLRPSLLRGIEENANRWVTTPSTSQVLDTSHDQVEQFVVSHARPVGWLLLLASLYLFFAMSRWLV